MDGYGSISNGTPLGSTAVVNSACLPSGIENLQCFFEVGFEHDLGVLGPEQAEVLWAKAAFTAASTTARGGEASMAKLAACPESIRCSSAYCTLLLDRHGWP